VRSFLNPLFEGSSHATITAGASFSQKLIIDDSFLIFFPVSDDYEMPALLVRHEGATLAASKHFIIICLSTSLSEYSGRFFLQQLLP